MGPCPLLAHLFPETPPSPLLGRPPIFAVLARPLAHGRTQPQEEGGEGGPRAADCTGEPLLVLRGG